MTRQTKAEQHAAIERLREWIRPGDTLYTTVNHVSRSGMYRTVQIRAILPESSRGERAVSVLFLGFNVATALGLRYDRKHEGIGMGGCGYDAAYQVIHDLSMLLFGASDKLRKETL